MIASRLKSAHRCSSLRTLATQRSRTAWGWAGWARQRRHRPTTNFRDRGPQCIGARGEHR
eukprot:6440017-Pyramimonas_sp.AAC.1